MNKKFFLMLLVMLLALAACGNNAGSKNDKLQIYTTVFPFKSFAEQIGGDHVEVKSIYPNGIDIHTYEPTQKDTLNIAKGDLFIYSSDDLDPVAGKIAKVIKEKDKKLAVAADINDKDLLANHHHHDEEEHAHDEHATKDEHDHEHEDEHAHDEHAGHSHAEGAHDPHVWLDPVLDEAFAKSIKDELVKKDPDHKADYEKNYKALLKDIQSFDKELKDITKNAKRDKVYISHESIGYLANRYGFKEVGVSGLNNDEPSQQEIVDMINNIKEEKIPYLLYEQNISSKITDIIKERTKTEAVPFHNMSVLTADEAKQKDVTYQTLMKKNIESLDKALNK